MKRKRIWKEKKERIRKNMMITMKWMVKMQQILISRKREIRISRIEKVEGSLVSNK